MDDYLTQGVAAVKAGKKQEARRLLDAAIRANPNDDRAWGWFYSVCINNEERIKCLEEILRINPNHAVARKRYNELIDKREKQKATPINPPVPVQAPKKKTNLPLILLFIIIGGCGFIILLTYLVGGSFGGILNHDVKYMVTGHNSADLTYLNETGGTEQQTVFLPWEYSMNISAGQFVYVSAQANGFNIITCTITVDDRVFKTSTSSGNYVITTCSGRIP